MKTHIGKASSFADPADLRAYRRCKAEGKTDAQCRAVGDNGVGFTGVFCATEERRLCAVPREDWKERWKSASAATGRGVVVRANGRTIIATIGDTMPARKYIKHGVVIDLNPGAAAALGLRPPFIVDAEWHWIDDEDPHLPHTPQLPLP